MYWGRMTTSSELDNLVRIGKLKREPPAQAELAGLQASGEARLIDASNQTLSLAGRFDLAYNAAHALALAALRRMGYRSDNRYLVFQTLPHTLGISQPMVRVLAKAHETRNASEYEGLFVVSEQLVADVIAAATTVRDALRAAGPLPG